MELCIALWTEYGVLHDEALSWLTDAEEQVRGYTDLKPDLESKRLALETFQNLLQQLFDWQKKFDQLNARGQLLIDTCSQASISNQVTSVGTRYNALLSQAKGLMRKLEQSYQEHQQHQSLYQECQDFVERSREKLNSVSPKSGTQNLSSLTELQEKMNALRLMAQSLEQAQNSRFRYLDELKARVVMSTEQTGAKKIADDTDNLKAEYVKLMHEVSEVRHNLAVNQAKLEDQAKAERELKELLELAEQKLCRCGEVSSGERQETQEGIVTDRATLERVKALDREVASYHELVDKLTASEYQPTVDKYKELGSRIAERLLALENLVKEQAEAQQRRDKATEWLRRSRAEILALSDCPSELKVLESKSNELKTIGNNLKDGKNYIYEALGSDSEDEPEDQLFDDYQQLIKLHLETSECNAKCISALSQFDTLYKNLNLWLDSTEKQIKNLNESDDLTFVRELVANVKEKGSDLENLAELGESVTDLTACPWARDKVTTTQSRYSELTALARCESSRFEKKATDLEEFNRAKKEAAEWLSVALGTVESCRSNENSLNESQLNDKTETLRLVSTRMTEGQHLVTKLQESHSKAVESTALSGGCDHLDSELTQIRADWDKLNRELNAVMDLLKRVRTRWEEFNELRNKLTSSLDETEKLLAAQTHSHAIVELGELKTLIERFKHINEDMDARRPDLQLLIADPLCPQELIPQLENRFETVQNQCSNLRQELEAELKERTGYQQALQAAERWLLQISFRLMAHNSLYITDREQTEEQLEQHEELLEEMHGFSSNLDDVKSKGQTQRDRLISIAPAQAETIDTQLRNVTESYDSLLKTALQIKSRLQESLAKFREYENSLESIWESLNELEPRVIELSSMPDEAKLEDIHKKQEEARLIHNKLQAEKARLATAVQACEAATACISRPSSPQDPLPAPVPPRELQVRTRLEDLIDQAQGALSLIDGAASILEGKMQQLNSLRRWLSETQSICRDASARPSKLRIEAHREDMAKIKELVSGLGERRAVVLPTLSENEVGQIKNEMDQLEKEVHPFI